VSAIGLHIYVTFVVWSQTFVVAQYQVLKQIRYICTFAFVVRFDWSPSGRSAHITTQSSSAVGKNGKMVNCFRYYRALESVSIASALSSALTIYPCQIRVYQRWQSKLQLPTARKKEWRPADAMHSADNAAERCSSVCLLFSYVWSSVRKV